MMSGFGDSQTPRAESVRLMEEIVLEYITALNAKVRFAHCVDARTRGEHVEVLVLFTDRCEKECGSGTV